MEPSEPILGKRQFNEVIVAVGGVLVAAGVAWVVLSPGPLRTLSVLFMVIGSAIVFAEVTDFVPRARRSFGRWWSERVFFVHRKLIRELHDLAGEYWAFHRQIVEFPTPTFTIGSAIVLLKNQVPAGDAQKRLDENWAAWLQTRQMWDATARFIVLACEGSRVTRRMSAFQAAVEALKAEVLWTRSFAQRVATEFRTAHPLTDDVQVLDVWKRATDDAQRLDSRLKILAERCGVEYFGGHPLPPLHAPPGVKDPS